MNESNDRWPYKPDRDAVTRALITLGLQTLARWWRRWRKRRKAKRDE